MTTSAQQLVEESNRATELLAGKVVAFVRRHRQTEVVIDFTDGTRFILDLSAEGVELSITGGKE